MTSLILSILLATQAPHRDSARDGKFAESIMERAIFVYEGFEMNDIPLRHFATRCRVIHLGDESFALLIFDDPKPKTAHRSNQEK